METRSLFDLNLADSRRGWLWSITTIHLQKSTGILTLEREASNKSLLRKEVAFDKGDPIAIRSNSLAETFGAFLIQKNKLSETQLKEQLESRKQAGSGKPLGEWLVSKDLLNPLEAGQLLEEHFQVRLSLGMNLRKGQVRFIPVSPLPKKVFEDGAIRLSNNLLQSLLKAAFEQYTEEFCRFRLRDISGSTPVRPQGEIHYPLPPADLRKWKDLQNAPRSLEQINGVELKLVALAYEFDQLQVRAEDSVAKVASKEAGPTHQEPAPSSMPANKRSPVVKETPLSEDPLQAEAEKSLIAKIEDFKRKPANEVLGVSMEADMASVKKAYLTLVKEHHPDRLSSDSSDKVRQLTEDLIALINEAHAVMADPEKREELKAEIDFEKSGGMKGIEEKIEAEMLFDQAKGALRRRHFAAALQDLKKINAIISDDGEMMADLVYAEFMSLLEAKKPVEAQAKGYLERLDQAISLRENYASAYYYKGLLYKISGEVKSALKFFDIAIEMDPKFNEAISEARVLRMKTDKEKSKKKGWFSK